MRSDINRRRFMGSAAALGAVAIVPRHVLGGADQVPPSEKITLAHIGMGTQSFSELGGLLADPRVQIVAVCDPNTDSHDYVEWGKNSIRNTIRGLLGKPNWRENQSGCPGGREVGRAVIDAYYANQRGGQKYKACAVYADFRELLDKAKDIDAVKIMTPDHLHATIAIAAMKRGKHVAVHKPLANRLHEGRLVVETARKSKVATHLLAYGSGAGNAAIVAQIEAGAIGPLREVHNWTNRPVWPQYAEIPKDRPPVPQGLDWNLWLGPALDRPYHPHYTHAVFRGWYDFGGGSMADMGIYSLWPVFAALKLDAPLSAEAWQTHTCAIDDCVSRTVRNDFAYPTACNIRFKFAARENMPAIDLFWYDGGMKPRLPADVDSQDIEMAAEGILFVGEQGAILAGFHGQNPQLFVKGKREPLHTDAAPPANKSVPKKPVNRAALWVDACRGGEPSPGSFLNAAAITDAVKPGNRRLACREEGSLRQCGHEDHQHPRREQVLVPRVSQGVGTANDVSVCHGRLGRAGNDTSFHSRCAAGTTVEAELRGGAFRSCSFGTREGRMQFAPTSTARTAVAHSPLKAGTSRRFASIPRDQPGAIDLGERPVVLPRPPPLDPRAGLVLGIRIMHDGPGLLLRGRTRIEPVGFARGLAARHGSDKERRKRHAPKCSHRQMLLGCGLYASSAAPDRRIIMPPGRCIVARRNWA